MNPRQPFATRQQRLVLSQANDTDAYGFFNLLTGPELLEDVEELLPAHRERLFPPTETLSMFIAQALLSDGSCKQVVNDAAVKRLVAGMPVCSSRTAAYCKARARLPRTMVSTLALRAGEIVAEGAADWWLWRNRRVRLADGATVTMADTEENQAKYPQPKSQRKGLSFPMMRVVALMCLASGALLDAATGACAGKGGDEQTLLRGMLDRLDDGDILLGDAFFPTYFLLCELLRRGVDGLFEQYAAADRRNTGRSAPGANRASCTQTPAEALPTDDQTESAGTRGRAAERSPEEATLSTERTFRTLTGCRQAVFRHKISLDKPLEACHATRRRPGLRAWPHCFFQWGRTDGRSV